MSTRYATIIPNDDGQEVVSNIAQIEGAAPLVGFGKVEKVADGVLIGMIRGVRLARCRLRLPEGPGRHAAGLVGFDGQLVLCPSRRIELCHQSGNRCGQGRDHCHAVHATEQRGCLSAPGGSGDRRVAGHSFRADVDWAMKRSLMTILIASPVSAERQPKSPVPKPDATSQAVVTISPTLRRVLPAPECHCHRKRRELDIAGAAGGKTRATSATRRWERSRAICLSRL